MAIGLDLAPTVVAATRVVFPSVVRDAFRLPAVSGSIELASNVAETLVYAVRQVLTRIGALPRYVFVAGLLDPARPMTDVRLLWSEAADRVAEQTGFDDRPRLSPPRPGRGGAVSTPSPPRRWPALPFAQPNAALDSSRRGVVPAESLSHRPRRCRRWSASRRGRAINCSMHWSIMELRGKELSDPGGKKAVQGRNRRLPGAGSALAPHANAVQDGPCRGIRAKFFARGLRCGAATQRWSPRFALHCQTISVALAISVRPRSGGCRSCRGCARTSSPAAASEMVFSGNWWAQQFPDGIVRGDEAGISPLARNAAGSAVLAALLCHGVAGIWPP